jgi:hypothetical protein
MLNTSTLTVAGSNPVLAPAVDDILDEIQGLPTDEARDHLRAAQDAVWHGAWRIPTELREPLILAIGGALA